MSITEMNDPKVLDPLSAEKSSSNCWAETLWHRDWKAAFPLGYRERTFLNRGLGYHHRADIFTPCGTAIEFQNSPICLEELRSRELFYPNLVWVVNGAKFKGFRVLKHLPDVDDPKLLNFEFSHSSNLTMVQKGQTKRMTFHHPLLRSITFTSHYYSFRWSNPHKVWYEAKCPIIIDLGGYFLYQLKQRIQENGNFPYLHMIPRQVFLNRYI
ncbi:MAG: competence protein [Bacteroidia bacterium]